MTKEYIISELKRYFKEYHKSPTFRSFATAKGYPAPITAVKRFGTWNNALIAAGLTLRQNRYNTNFLLDWIRAYYKKQGRYPKHRDIPGGVRQGLITAFGSVSKAFKRSTEKKIESNLNKSKLVPKNKVIKLIKSFIKKYKRNPSLKDISTAALPINRFNITMLGGISQFWSRKYPSNNPFTAYIFYFSKDHHKCFSLSEKILDNWFHSHKIIHEREIYYPKDSKLNRYNNLRCDFYLPDFNLYVEFAGISGDPEYTKRLARKREIAKKYKMNLIFLGANDINSNGKLNIKRLESLFVTK